MKPSASTASVMSRSGEATCGLTTVLASGTKISAAPKPEKPRAIAAMKAVASRKARPRAERSGGSRSGIWNLVARRAGKAKRARHARGHGACAPLPALRCDISPPNVAPPPPHVLAKPRISQAHGNIRGREEKSLQFQGLMVPPARCGSLRQTSQKRKRGRVERGRRRRNRFRHGG